MTITISLSPETEERVRQKAAESGQTVDGFVQKIVEREVSGGNGTRVVPSPSFTSVFPSDQALAPFRQEVAASGMTDEELLEFFEGAREEVYREKQGQPGKPS